jgi:hypothetical protein
VTKYFADDIPAGKVLARTSVIERENADGILRVSDRHISVYSPRAQAATVELSQVQHRTDFKEEIENVLFILRRGCRTGLELL